MFTNIVAAVTPSPACEPAVDKAIAFAQRFESSLSFIYVCHLDEGWGSLNYHVPFADSEKLSQGFEEHYREKLRGVESYEIQVVPGVPHTEILRLARKRDADLIVMGPHTKQLDISQAKTGALAGSCLQRVSQKAHCPVMIVSYPEPYGEQSFNNLLVATDLSSAAECAVSYSCQLAKRYNASLHLVHVMDLDLYYPWSLPSQREIVRYLKESKEALRSAFGTTLEPLAGWSIEAWEGIPAVEILKWARLKKADLIIMAHHSKEKDPEKAFLGSTVAKVALRSMCPTMSINRSYMLSCEHP